jgi:hypothetical protein
MAYVYNADDQDGIGEGGTYGFAPPAVGFHLLSGPDGPPNGRDDDRDGIRDETGERLGATVILGGHDDVCGGFDPLDGRDAYDRMRGRWRGGDPILQGGWGCDVTGPITSFVFPGDPVAGEFWSERCATPDANCLPHPSGDRRVLLASGPFRISRGESQEITIAIPFAAGESHLDSVSRLRVAADVLSNAQNVGLLDAQRVPGFLSPALPSRIEIRRPAPNPFDDAATIGITLPAAADVRVALFDVLGRAVLTAQDGTLEAGAHDLTIDAAGLAPGAYVARVWVAGQDAGALPLTRR